MASVHESIDSRNNHLQIDGPDHADGNGSQYAEWSIDFPPVEHDAETTAPVKTRQIVQDDDADAPADERVELIYNIRRLGYASHGSTAHKFATARKNVASWLQVIVTQNLACGMATEFVDIRPVDRPPVPRGNHFACESGTVNRRNGDASNFDRLTNADTF